MKKIFIDRSENFQLVGIVEDNILMELYIEKNEVGNIVGNIYRARVMNILEGMEASFIDIGFDKNGYLPVKEADILNEKRKITELLKNGDEILVQVIKVERGEKGAKLTRKLEIPGRYLVITPTCNKISISRRIKDMTERNRLKNLGNNCLIEEIGIIFRTASQEIEDDILIAEYNQLIEIYNKIQGEKNFLPIPKLLYSEPKLGEQLIRDRFTQDIDSIIVNSKEDYLKLKDMDIYYEIGLDKRLILDKDFQGLYEPSIRAGIREGLSRRVDLKSGGYLVIDELEALNFIDVNTGGYTGNLSLEDTVYKLNLEASIEIARQIRLRNLGGIIIIDFIDMKNKKNIDNLLKYLSLELNKDNTKTNIVDITKLGLVELTREKIRKTLSEEFHSQCLECNGSGNIVEIKY